jgi:hypothetical protein
MLRFERVELAAQGKHLQRFPLKLEDGPVGHAQVPARAVVANGIAVEAVATPDDCPMRLKESATAARRSCSSRLTTTDPPIRAAPGSRSPSVTLTLLADRRRPCHHHEGDGTARGTMAVIGARTWLEHLSPAECWDLLASTPAGRIGILNDSAAEIYPVNRVVDRHTIVFHTDPGSKLRGLLRTPTVCTRSTATADQPWAPGIIRGIRGPPEGRCRSNASPGSGVATARGST